MLTGRVTRQTPSHQGTASSPHNTLSKREYGLFLWSRARWFGRYTCATACTIRLGPLPRYVLAPMNTAPREMAARSFSPAGCASSVLNACRSNGQLESSLANHASIMSLCMQANIASRPAGIALNDQCPRQATDIFALFLNLHAPSNKNDISRHVNKGPNKWVVLPGRGYQRYFLFRAFSKFERARWTPSRLCTQT